MQESLAPLATAGTVFERSKALMQAQYQQQLQHLQAQLHEQSSRSTRRGQQSFVGSTRGGRRQQQLYEQQLSLSPDGPKEIDQAAYQRVKARTVAAAAQRANGKKR